MPAVDSADIRAEYISEYIHIRVSEGANRIPSIRKAAYNIFCLALRNVIINVSDV